MKKILVLAIFTFSIQLTPTQAYAESNKTSGNEVSLQVAKFAAEVQGYFEKAAFEDTRTRVAKALICREEIADFESGNKLTVDQQGLIDETKEALANYVIHPSASQAS